jgi:octaprenyl-diphosphate synthase
MTVKEIQAPIRQELEEFEFKFKGHMDSQNFLLNKITHYIVKRKGKQMRPMFVFLTAKAFGKITESAYTAASLIELLHTATLVHDDVVDDSFERRGFLSVNAVWKNKVAVLVGDFLLSKGLLISTEQNEFELLKIMSTAVKEMSEGELLQIEKARRLDITEDVYYEVIRQKTASLIASCCAAGAHASTKDVEIKDKMWAFGEAIGMAFQIKDDIFDYGSGDKIGKPTGIDIRERKMTLPLIYALNNADKKTKKRMINIIKNHNENRKKVQEVVDFVISSGGIQYADKKMHEYKGQAIKMAEIIPESESKEALLGLLEYTINREK